jgi:type IV secretion system protein TrbL
MLIYLMLGVFTTISNNWISTMNGYTADLPITQIFPTLMSMLLFAFASWMIPKMAASIASGTLGAGAADLVGMGMEVAKGAALTAATVAVVAATGGAGAAAGGALAATETAGAAAEGAGAAGSAGMAAAGGAGDAAMEASSAPPPPVPGPTDSGSASAPPAPPPPPSAAESQASAPSAPPAQPSTARNLQTLAQHATNIHVPNDGSGHSPSAQLRVEREE